MDQIGFDHQQVFLARPANHGQQIRSISKKRLRERIGSLKDEKLQTAIENRLLEHLNIAFEPDEE